jgi:RND family efflux transporter MFP subunit
MKRIFTKKKIIITLVVLVIVAIGYFLFRGQKPKIEYTTEKVVRGNLIQTVSETGAIKAAEKINLNFLNSGSVSRIFVNIGDQVAKDQPLAELENQSYVLKEREAYANYLVAEANLSKVLAGATSEEVGVSQANVTKAQAAYSSALNELDKTKTSINNNIAQAEQKLSDLLATSPIKSSYRQTVENRKASSLTVIEDKNSSANLALDSIKKLLDDNDAEGVLSVKDSSYLDNTRVYYDLNQPLLAAAKSSLTLAKANATDANINEAFNDSLASLTKVYDNLNYAYKALEKSITSTSFPQITLDAYKTSISANLTSVSAAISSEQSAKQNLADANISLNDAIQTAENNLSTAEKAGEQQIASAQAQVDNSLETWNVAKAQLSQTNASPRTQDISLFQAQVAQAQAAWELAKKQLADATIKAPIDGVITESNYKVGEQVNAAEYAFTMVGNNDYEIKVDISEADISKVEIGDPTEVTLDAFGEDIKFSGTVSFIEPAETVIQDVIYYKVTIRIVKNDTLGSSFNYYDSIKPGMTANVSITTAKKENVIIAPGRAILEKNGQGKFIRIMENGVPREVAVSTGLKGDGGLVEIVDGVKEGDEVVTYVKEPAK